MSSYIRAFRDAGMQAYEIKRAKLDERNFEGVRSVTMHRVKGLEFQYMFIAAAKRNVKPLLMARYIEMTILDKPSSKPQKHRLANKGKVAIRQTRLTTVVF